jgi:hypothetical protein
MADPRPETDIEPETELSPEQAARLLAAVQRAREDAAAGRVYRTGRAGLEALLARFDQAGVSGRDGDPEAVDAVIAGAIADGLLHPASDPGDLADTGDAEASPRP